MKSLNATRIDFFTRDISIWSLPIVLASLWVARGELYLEGDSVRAIESAYSILNCLDTSKDGCIPSQFGPSMLLFPFLLFLSGASHEFAIRVLALMSLLFFHLNLYLVYRFRNFIGRFWKLLFVALSTGQSFAYSGSSFSESFTGSLAIIIILSLLKSNLLTAGLASMLFASSRENAFLFVFMIYISCYFLDSQNEKVWRLTRIVFPFSLTIIGTSFVFLSNKMKFGHFGNAYYTNDNYFIFDFAFIVSSFVGQWLSPSAGIMFFSPLLCLLIWSNLRSWSDGRTTLAHNRLTESRINSSLFLLLLSVMLPLSAWFAPFGWYSWGGRLQINVSQAVALLSTLALAQLSNSKIYNFRLFLTLGIVNLLAIIGRMFAQVDPLYTLFGPEGICGSIPVFEAAPRTQYIDCLILQTWTVDNSLTVLGLKAAYDLQDVKVITITIVALVLFAKLSAIARNDYDNVRKVNRQAKS